MNTITPWGEIVGRIRVEWTRYMASCRLGAILKTTREVNAECQHQSTFKCRLHHWEAMESFGILMTRLLFIPLSFPVNMIFPLLRYSINGSKRTCLLSTEQSHLGL